MTPDLSEYIKALNTYPSLDNEVRLSAMRSEPVAFRAGYLEDNTKRNFIRAYLLLEQVVKVQKGEEENIGWAFLPGEIEGEESVIFFCNNEVVRDIVKVVMTVFPLDDELADEEYLKDLDKYIFNLILECENWENKKDILQVLKYLGENKRECFYSSLGNFHRYTENFVDYEQSNFWYRRGCVCKNTEVSRLCNAAMGVSYYEGLAVDKDWSLAEHYFLKAKALGIDWVEKPLAIIATWKRSQLNSREIIDEFFNDETNSLSLIYTLELPRNNLELNIKYGEEWYGATPEQCRNNQVSLKFQRALMTLSENERGILREIKILSKYSGDVTLEEATEELEAALCMNEGRSSFQSLNHPKGMIQAEFEAIKENFPKVAVTMNDAIIAINGFKRRRDIDQTKREINNKGGGTSEAAKGQPYLAFEEDYFAKSIDDVRIRILDFYEGLVEYYPRDADITICRNVWEFKEEEKWICNEINSLYRAELISKAQFCRVILGVVWNNSKSRIEYGGDTTSYDHIVAIQWLKGKDKRQPAILGVKQALGEAIGMFGKVVANAKLMEHNLVAQRLRTVLRSQIENKS